MKQRHLPIVDAYVAGDLERVRTIAAQITPSHPMYKYYSLLSAFTLLNRKENAASEVCAQIPAILDAPPEDPELFVILLRTFVLAAVNSNHVSEAQRCMRLLRNSDERNI